MTLPNHRPARLAAVSGVLAMLVWVTGCAGPVTAPPPSAASPITPAPTPPMQAASSETVPVGAAPSALHTEWRIVQARSEPLMDRRRARLEFRADGRLLGHTSCNSLSGSYGLDGDRIQLGPVVTTRMACDRLLMEQEDRVLTALEGVATARVRPDGILELRDADGRGLLRAVRADAPE